MSAVSLGASPSAGATPPKKAAPPNIRVGLLADVGGLNDHGFNHLSYVGVLEAHQKLGVAYSVVQATSSADYLPALTNFARSGDQAIIADAFLEAQALQQVSKEFPHQHYMMNDDIVKGPNITSIYYETQQCGYLAGYLAGLVQKEHALPHINGDNTVGIVGGQEIPPVNTYIAGFIGGIRAVDPTVHILLKYTGTFSDPSTGASYAQAEIADHADIVWPVAGGTGLGVISEAKKEHVYAIGVDANQNYLAPGTVITSAEKNVSVAVFDFIKSVKDGTVKPGVRRLGLSQDGVGIAPPIKAVPRSIVAKVDQLEKEIVAGKVVPPTTIPKNLL